MDEQQPLVRKYKSLIAHKTLKHGLGLPVNERQAARACNLSRSSVRH